MTNTRDIVIKLKEVKEERNLSLGKIIKMLEEQDAYISKSTLSKIFSEGSEELNYDYENTIRPIANALLDMERIEETDNMDVKAIKTILKYKMERIEELEKQLQEERLSSYEKLEQERTKFQRSLDFLKEQITLKDKRIDMLLESVIDKDKQIKGMNEHIINCPYRKEKL